jgi:hypothetical protein
MQPWNCASCLVSRVGLEEAIGEFAATRAAFPAGGIGGSHGARQAFASLRCGILSHRVTQISRPFAALMAGVTDRLWAFEDLFEELLLRA